MPTSKKTRLLIALATLALLLALSLHYTSSLLSDPPPHVNLNALTYSPEEYRGESLWTQGFVRAKDHQNGKTTLTFETSYGSLVAVIPPELEVSEGALIAIKGEFKNSTLHASEVHTIGYRRLRYFLSLLAFLPVLYLVIKNYRPTWEGIHSA